MEIKQLIDRYMNGQTTVDEEQLLARYFRSATDLPDDLQPYRDMFAYFDEGMPLGTLPEFDGSAGQAETRVAPDSSKVVAPRRHSLRMAAWWSGAVAAAVALLLIMYRPSAPVQPIASAVVVSDTCSTSTGVEAEQNVVTDSVKLKPQPQRRRPSVRRRYYIAPPKTYLAHAAATDSITHAANANMNGSATDCLVAIHELSEAERQSIERDIRESLRLVDEVRNTLLAVDMLNQIDDEAADEQY
ncbi:hypothetical protein [Prevotella sp.]|uniref:hypothetical protein n=1 Tax=Prevotella sp. TaxID=59823 RepID=UPI0030789892